MKKVSEKDRLDTSKKNGTINEEKDDDGAKE